MFSAKVKAYAKLNLTLDIVGVKDGYHLLDSFVASLDLYDLVVVKKRKDKLVSVVMHGLDSESIPMEQNNAFKAGEAFVSRFSTTGADITVYKNIPMGAGLGGSSADAAGALNALAKLYGVTDRTALKEIADSLGSDTGYMLDGGFCRMSGRGTDLERVESKQKLWLLLICPRSSVSAGACYREYDKEPFSPFTTAAMIEAFKAGDINGVGRYASNALYLPAARLNPEVETALAEARSFSPLGAAMTGSGSCVFALFENREMCEWAKSRYKGKFRTYVVSTVTGGVEKKRGFRSPFTLSKEEIEEAE